MRILVAVLAARAQPYPWLARTIERTWASVPTPEVEVLFYYGGSEGPVRGGRELVLPVDDRLEHVGDKTAAFFQWATERVEFDLLFRTNLSSYVDLPGLRAYALANARPGRFYAGHTGTHDGFLFAGGSGYFLSRDLVEVAGAARPRWNPRVLDDVALAEILAEEGVRPVPAPRKQYSSLEEAEHADTSFFHFRCKTPSRVRYGDVRIMLAIHRAFLRARGDRQPWTFRRHELVASAVEQGAALTAPIRRIGR